MMTIGDSAVIVRFRRDRWLGERGKIARGRRPGDGTPRGGFVDWRCGAVTQASLCGMIFVSRLLGCGYLVAGCGISGDEIPRAIGCH